MRDRLATELAEEREARLQQMRDRLATESVEEREARLQQMSTRERERLATESAEEREARLQQMRDRLATESAEERELGQAAADEGPTGLCVRCCRDKHVPKMCSSANNNIWTLAPYHPSCRLALIRHANTVYDRIDAPLE